MNYEDIEVIKIEVASATEADVTLLKAKLKELDAAVKTLSGIDVSDLDLSSYAKLEDLPVVPEDVSSFNNDAGYLTEHQSLEDYALKSDVDNQIANIDLSTKQDVVEDLEEIRAGAALGSTSIQEHQDISGKQDIIPDLETIRALANSALQEHQDISGKADINHSHPEYLTEHIDISGKQDVITDLATIRAGAALGATALQEHQDISGKADVRHTHPQYLTEHQSLADYVTKSEFDATLNEISDIVKEVLA